MLKKHIFIHLPLFFSVALAAQTGQITVPRVELMPNQPAPYNVRDWKQVALRYDSFVYDLNKTGQYLPLVSLVPAGVNYPQNPFFRLHTYVGTNSPQNSEGINVLPSLVSATLVGADKTDQYGRNWLLMSQDFFNKSNGENLYLNNPNTSSGNDWWYDMMPNVYFYQLYDLYPNMGGDAGFQFTAIADQFLKAVRAMGGSDTPWEPAYMNYRAWKFKTMEPNPNGVKEPEAAGAFAWVLYNAWKETGNPEYLKGAEWSIEFLSNWTANPSYELQLPYGTYTAARMNAELGTKYDVEKMLNWSFNRGDLRGWGTIVGNWGGFDVSGLVGEANDNGNDYAFQLNGVQQAAALAPMVRYDKRFARAIGKWMLNLTNATRLMFPGFLPADKQDATAWSTTHDPQQVIGYEALREQWQGQSPFSTGDALQGGWAGTNLSLYSTSSIGYLGALVKKTNVDRILQIDLRKTDFFGAEAYPTYLYYNSYGITKVVQIDVGSQPVDIYNTLTETFLVQNATGTVNLTIPGNQAIMAVLAPAGGAVTYDENRMLIDGVVVDYNQHAQAYTLAPRIQALAAEKNPLELGDSSALYATVSDGDSGNLTYEWSTTIGTISGSGATVQFIPPATEGEADVRVIVIDPDGNRDTASLLISVVPEINDAPQIVDIQKSAAFSAPSGSIQLTAVAEDENNDPLTYMWTANGGSFTGTGSAVEWNAPATEGIYLITLKVADDEGLSAQTTTNVLVKVFGVFSGTIIAHYPFTGNANDVSGHNLHGQVNGAVLTADLNGAPQSAYFFNGSTQHILVPTNALLNFQDGITVSCWFNADALPEKETFILSHGSWQNRWKVSITPERYLRWTVNTLNGVSDLDSDIPLETGTDYHVAVTYDGSLLGLYLNGQLRSYKVLTGKIRTTTVPFLMGQMLPEMPEYNFKGVIDEVKIFDDALPPDAVAALYGLGVTGVHTALNPAMAGLVLSPNPVSGILNVDVNVNVGRVLNPADVRKIEIRDLSGRLVLEKTATGTNTTQIDVTHCRPGIYTVFLISDNTRAAARFVKI